LPNSSKLTKKLKKACFWQAFFPFNAVSFFGLVFYNCFVRASAGASAATNAGVRVDDIDVAFRNSAHWAFVNASAASNAAVCDFVSHNDFNFRVCFEFSSGKNTNNFHSNMPQNEIFIQSK
jgi:hypothetical protein